MRSATSAGFDRYGIGLDYTLKRYVPQQIDPSWGELGWALLKAIANHAAAPINPGKPN